MSTSTNNTSSTNTVTNPSPATTVRPPNNPPAPTTSLGGWAGSLWTLLLQLEALSSKIESSMLDTLTKNMNMQFDEGRAAANAQIDQANANAKATEIEGIASLVGGGLTLGISLGTMGMAKWGSDAAKANEAETELTRLKKVNSDHFLNPRRADIMAGEGNAGLRDENVQARIDEMRDSVDGFTHTNARANLDNHMIQDGPTMNKEEMAAFDEAPNGSDRSVYDQLGNDRAAVKANLDKAISSQQLDLEIARKKVNDNLQGLQMLTQCTTGLASGTGAMFKQDQIQKAGNAQSAATVAQAEQQGAQQAASTLKSFIDKAADSGVSAVQQIMGAIQASLKN